MFYAIPEMHTRDGQIVNAIFGVAKFIKSLTEMSPNDTIIVASESGSNFRETLYAEYKGTRDRMPDNLRSQIDGVFDFFRLTGIPVLVREGYEADDIIGSIAHDPDGYDEVIIISSDKDLCQFVKDGRVRIYDAMKQKNLRRTDVIEKFGVPPEQVKDYLAIVWDSSDNIPGIAGFGPKKAVDLLTKYNTLEGIYDNMSDLTEKMQTILIEQKENAFLSQKLASIVVDLDISIEDVKWVDSWTIFQAAPVIEFLKKYEFKSLIPLEYREAKKELSRWKVVIIEDQNMLLSLEKEYISLSKIYLSFQWESQLALWLWDTLYSIDIKRVDITDFFSWLLASNIEIVGYDLKEDMKKIIALKNPLQAVEGQGKLF
jgi:DNA polymerase-1